MINPKTARIGLVVLAVVALATVLLFYHGWDRPERVLNAKIRYFDGVSEMVELRGYQIMNGFIRLDTAAGDRIYVGANNVIITDEEADR